MSVAARSPEGASFPVGAFVRASSLHVGAAAAAVALQNERNQRFRQASILAVLGITRPKQPLLGDETERNHQRDHDAKGQGLRR